MVGKAVRQGSGETPESAWLPLAVIGHYVSCREPSQPPNFQVKGKPE